MLRKLGRGLRWSVTWPVVLLALPLALFIRSFNRLFRIRYGYFLTHRIGHFSFDLEYFLSGKKLQGTGRGTRDLFYLVGKHSNSYLVELSKRNLNISFWYQFLHKADKLLSFSSDIAIEPAWLKTGSRDYEGRLAKTSPHIKFRQDEETYGWEILRNLGIHDSDKFVCLIVRDSAYLETIDGPGRRDYHSFRDSDVQDYRHVANELAQKGYWVLRMGKVVKSKFDVAHPKVIDYANSDWRSDFLDIWLMSKCYFCISTSTGFDAVGDMFRKSFAFVNFMPLRYFQTWSSCVLAPSHLIWKHSGTYLNCRDHLRHGYQKSEQYEVANIEIRTLQPEEITATVLELEARLGGTWPETTKQVEYQEKFWDIYKTIEGETPATSFYHPNAFLSSAFLEKHPSFLE